MRTTIDLPDELFRQAKATAALRGLKFKDFVTQILEEALKGRQAAPRETPRARRVLPVIIPDRGVKIQALSNVELETLFLQEDLERLGLG